MIVAETERLRLRELTPDDAAFVLELVNEPAWLQFIGDRNVHSLDDARAYIARGPAASYAEHGFGLWAVESLAGGEALGMCGLVKRAALEHVDMGFAFLERHWGHGHAREAAAEVVRLARERYRLPTLVAITDPDNGPSQRVLESAGFRYDRTIAWGETNEALMLYVQELASPHRQEGRVNPEFKLVLKSQIGAAIDMLENAMRACPAAVWDDTGLPVSQRFWYLAYHTLFWLDFYLSDQEQGFAPPAPFTLGEFDPAGVYPDRTYSLAELLGYLAHGRDKLHHALARLSDERAVERCGFTARDMSVLELYLYNLRHVQHHAAQLNLVLRQRTDSAPAWVGRGRTSSVAR